MLVDRRELELGTATQNEAYLLGGCLVVHWRERKERRRGYNLRGHAHELTFSCFNRHKFFQAERTCHWLAEAIQAARKKQCFTVWAYVFMPDHVHIIVHPERIEYDISIILAAIKEPVGRKAIAHIRLHQPDWLERLTVCRGSRMETRFWEPGGGFDRNVDEPATLLKMIDYIHMNPVRKNLSLQAKQWKWSSAGWFEGEKPNDLIPDPIPTDWSIIGGA